MSGCGVLVGPVDPAEWSEFCDRLFDFEEALLASDHIEIQDRSGQLDHEDIWGDDPQNHENQ